MGRNHPMFPLMRVRCHNPTPPLGAHFCVAHFLRSAKPKKGRLVNNTPPQAKNTV